MARIGLAHFGDCRVSATARNDVNRTIITRESLCLNKWPQFEVSDDAERSLAMMRR